MRRYTNMTVDSSMQMASEQVWEALQGDDHPSLIDAIVSGSFRENLCIDDFVLELEWWLFRGVDLGPQAARASSQPAALGAWERPPSIKPATNGGKRRPRHARDRSENPPSWRGGGEAEAELAQQQQQQQQQQPTCPPPRAVAPAVTPAAARCSHTPMGLLWAAACSEDGTVPPGGAVNCIYAILHLMADGSTDRPITAKSCSADRLVPAYYRAMLVGRRWAALALISFASEGRPWLEGWDSAPQHCAPPPPQPWIDFPSDACEVGGDGGEAATTEALPPTAASPKIQWPPSCAGGFFTPWEPSTRRESPEEVARRLRAWPSR